MIDNTAKAGQSDGGVRGAVGRIAAPAVNATHQITWSRWALRLPSGRLEMLRMPLAAAVAVEEAGYLIELAGRLNEGNVPA